MARIDVQTVAKGPVFAEWRLSYTFQDPGETGTVEAVPLMLGKHSFRYAPNVVPSETIPSRQRDRGVRG